MADIILNPDQEQAIADLKIFVNQPQKDGFMYLLEGAAGTGKTTTVIHLLEWLVDNVHSVCVCSPTHKALKVMKNMCPEHIVNRADFATLHSMLGLKHEITSDGSEIFVREKGTASNYQTYRVVLVDESSMVADQLFHELVDQNMGKTKIIFIGDSNQINPVNHTMSIPMLGDARVEHNIGHAMLRKIVRQAEGNPIIEFSQKVLSDTADLSTGHKTVNNGKGLAVIGQGNREVLHRLVQMYFCTDVFDIDPDYCKIIAWRNNTVDRYNRLVRAFKYGRDAPKFVHGEKLIVDRPVKMMKETIFNTNEELVVTEIDIGEIHTAGSEWKVYTCRVIGDSGMETPITLLHEDEQVRYVHQLEALSKIAKKEKDQFKRKDLWKKYFQFQENFAKVKYNYAITCHCSQGSTYDNCLVDFTDIGFNRNEDERRRIQYTAVTRPRNMLFIL